MPENTELWPGGEAPGKLELQQYLRTLGLDIDDARAVADRYVDPTKPGLSGGPDVNWTESRLRSWVDAQPEVRAARGQAPAEAGGGDLRTAFERVADEARERVDAASGAADRAVGEAGRRRDRFYRAADFVFDSGPAIDGAAMAQSLAVQVFTDASGNVVYFDPSDMTTPLPQAQGGVPKEVTAQTLWQAIKGQTFDMGALAIPRAPNRRQGRPRAGREGADDARLARLDQIATERRRFVTPSMAMALLNNMDDDGIIRIQQQLWEAGLFGDVPPSWGVADEVTRKAYMGLFAEASLTPDEPIDRVLARLTDEAVARGANGSGAGEDIPAFTPEVASRETLSAMVDDIAQDLLGRFPTDEERSRLVDSLQAKDVETQRAAYDRDLAGATGGGGGIDAFMAAIGGLESGGDYDARNPSGASGKYQIMPANWGPWAERAGLGRNAPRTPENQETVARAIMGDYYRQFGNWRDVAIAWFAGPGAVGSADAERRSDGNMTVREYADSIMARMGEAGTTAGGSYDAIETFDPRSEAEAALKAADPAGWVGHTFATRASEFYSLLSGVV